ncbi:MAG: YdeI/OmpD-associated family protein [Chloroflexi bacterium]|nr:YdeI/OmpD-associated family protein [Chloroflexota bacterium]
MLFESMELWEQWLEGHHTETTGVWLQIAKKDTGKSSVSYAEALTVALCFGWVDGQKQKFDEQYFLQRFTPRRAKSPWSKINRDKATELIAQGKMRPAGLREVEAAQRDGRWDAAYESQRNVTVPDDLQAALDANPAAKTFFEQLDRLNRYAILYPVITAIKPETRQKRIEKFIAMLAEKKTRYPVPAKKQPPPEQE